MRHVYSCDGNFIMNFSIVNSANKNMSKSPSCSNAQFGAGIHAELNKTSQVVYPLGNKHLD